MNVLYNVILSMFISFFIGIMFNAKLKITVIGAVLNGLCYGIFRICGGQKAGYFIAAAVLALLSEILAKKIKAPSSLFLIIGIYPLAPGFGIYQTIMSIINADYITAIQIGGDTFVNITIIATAIALVSILFNKSTESVCRKNI